MRTQPNILLLFQRRTQLPLYGADARRQRVANWPTRPTLTGCCATVFNNAYCQMPLCTPSRICLLAGRAGAALRRGTTVRSSPPDVPSMPAFWRRRATRPACGKMHFGGNRQFNGFSIAPMTPDRQHWSPK
ncbi:MAG: sulfatase-like hydrolase/transferase [Caldilineaceae bacterium]